MTGYRAALSAEILKARRAPVLWVCAAGFSLLPLVGGLFMYILKDPGRAQRMGLIGQKAQLTAGTADWPAFLGMIAQGTAIGGTILFAFVTAWVFGREFADRTIRVLLALPTPRAAIVAAKATLTAGWCAGMAAWVLGLGLVVGALSDLPPVPASVFVAGAEAFAAVATMTIGLQAITALVASAGRGYLAPVGFTFAALAAGNILAVLGWGAWFPWSIPALASGMAGPDAGLPTAASYLIVAIVSAAGFVGTVAWWQRADQAG